MSAIKKRGGPLEGVRVVELTKVWAGPYTGKLLSYLGAEVIRVESLGSMDVTRTYGVEDINNAPGWKAVNPQKLSVQINMKSEEGLSRLKDLLATADVLVENLRPGAMERLGLGYEAVKAAKPDIIYVSMGMYGAEGPLAYQTGYAPCFAALGGLSALVGYEGEAPTGMNVRYADSTFGTAAAYAAVVALFHRGRTGVGQFIDVSAVETMSSMIGDALINYSLNGVVEQCNGNRRAEMAPHGVYPCAGGDWVAIAAHSEPAWQALAGLLGLAGDGRFATLADRKANEAELDKLLGEWSCSQEVTGLVEQLQAAGVAAAKSENSLDLIADGNLWAREFYPNVTDAQAGSRMTVGPSWKMTRMAEITDGAPALGEHNAYVYGEILGLSQDEQDELVNKGVCR
ncbi:CaiB/BaiF CoA-transferase family protein [Pseudomaricurvus sp. HS19]|uniref:CaiB/BaiF CoA transferase family protein n=1 Tax=Pseudomaricurvus sp. HS19 TaxID=2692626 RepID=UPI001371ACA7|nr:CaiB/BaiF CoA-transferase family protein [Pseudomaricurvus sp. HS19]MYM63911.1 CoA transferase [Pseudomaricurvus sp. HS19]